MKGVSGGRGTLWFFFLLAVLYFEMQEYLKSLHQWWIFLVFKQKKIKEYFFFKIAYEKFVWSFLTYFILLWSEMYQVQQLVIFKK